MHSSSPASLEISVFCLINTGDENFNKSFLRIIDNDADGIITAKEMKEFTPCPEYDGKKLAREFKEYGRKADLN
jgi:Ca2+-binding EF-hand superfamily protein